MFCRNCGDPVDPQRVDLGFDYCLKEECQRRCLRPVQLASVGVNKAADYIMKAEEVVRPLVPVGPVYDRFCRGEITAKDLDSERRGLIRAFNNRVMSENIRYRSMLRRLP